MLRTETIDEYWQLKDLAQKAKTNAKEQTSIMSENLQSAFVRRYETRSRAGAQKNV